MVDASSSIASAARARRVRRPGQQRAAAGAGLGAGLLGAALLGLGCAQMLGVPSDPEFVPPPSPSQSSSTPPLETAAAPLPSASAPSSSPGEPAEPANDRPNSDGVVPPASVSGIEESARPGPADLAPQTEAAALDAGPDGAAREPLPEPAAAPPCEVERVPVDVVFIVDNSGSMLETDTEFELALPAFADRLDNDRVDYRIILLSRHRQDVRGISDEADTSVCIAGPLSGLGTCPSERPAPGPRFFPYNVKIDDTDSLVQILASFSAPDSFGLAPNGWSEWLRPGARKIFTEITDADSALSSTVFTSALLASAPDLFGADPASPGFVFHSIVGMLQKVLALDLYRADEPLELGVCNGRGSNPDNAGQTYQELSRSTGGLRQSICPANAMGLRLQVLATDIVRRSFSVCPATG